MSRRTLIRAAAGTVAAAATIALLPGTAYAGPGEWTPVSRYTGATTYPQTSAIDTAGLLRVGTDLAVVWRGSTAALSEQYLSAKISRTGVVLASPSVALDGWTDLSRNPVLAAVGGTPWLVFSGLHSTDTTDPLNSGRVRYATSPDGLAWTRADGVLAANKQAYGDYGTDVVDDGTGKPFTVTNGNGTSNFFNRGIWTDDTVPDDTEFLAADAGCCSYHVATARDTSTGEIFGAYYSSADASAVGGTLVARLAPTQGPVVQAPGSYTTGRYTGSIDTDQRTPLVARAGGGVYVAYATGYPSVTRIRVWRVGGTQVLDVPAPGAYSLSLGATADGRLWLSWIDRGADPDVVRAVRSNRTGTRWGAVVNMGHPAGSSALWRTANEASTPGLLDVVATATARASAGTAVNVFHSQGLPGLTAAAASSVRRGGLLTVAVTDAGDPVPGATVSFAGRTATTNSSGQAAFRVPAAQRTGAYGIGASRAGFVGAATRTTVTR